MSAVALITYQDPGGSVADAGARGCKADAAREIVDAILRQRLYCATSEICSFFVYYILYV